MSEQLTLPVLPYRKTSGHSGSKTSLERAVRRDSTGETLNNQQFTLGLLESSGTNGVTWKELSLATGWHHGTASGVLSVLHKAQRIERLTQTRSRCAIYVALGFVDGREMSKPKYKSCKHCGGIL